MSTCKLYRLKLDSQNIWTNFSTKCLTYHTWDFFFHIQELLPGWILLQVHNNLDNMECTADMTTSTARCVDILSCSMTEAVHACKPDALLA